jgi:hypothetical protein
MYVEVGNFYYYLYIAIAIFLTISLILFLRNKNDQVKNKVILFLLFSAFALHFLKLAFYPYNQMFPTIIKKITFENICAISTLIFPFIYLSKNKILKDYMLIMGIAAGIAAYAYPTEAIFDTFDSVYFGRKQAFSFDVIRFYYAHFVIFAVPFLMGYFKIHVFSFKRILYFPMMVLLIFLVIFLNEVLLIQFGLIEQSTIYDIDVRNSSFVFGIPEHYKNAAVIFDIFVFDFLKTYPKDSANIYWPVIWFIVPAFIYGPILATIVAGPFTLIDKIKIKYRH